MNNEFLLQTNNFLNNYKSKKSLYRPEYHLSGLTNWVNDPHGIKFFNGYYHIYFQFNPYKDKDGIHWGHVKTKDFVNFSKQSVVISPEDSYDFGGCWSGSTVVFDNKLLLYYTGYTEQNNIRKQVICLAISTDGEHFTKYKNNPLIETDDIPPFGDKVDFRDPYVILKNNMFHMFIGGKSSDHKHSYIYHFTSKDPYNFKYQNLLIDETNYGSMFECPNVITFDDNNTFLVVSPMDLQPQNYDFYNISSNCYTKLDKDSVSNKNITSNITKFHEIDHGLEYYACSIDNESKISLAWMQMWGRNYVFKELNCDFINNFTLFKKVKLLKNGSLQFVPVENYNNFFKPVLNETNISLCNTNKDLDFKIPLSSKITFNFDIKDNPIVEIKLNFNNRTNEYSKLILDFEKNEITLDRSLLKLQLKGNETNSASNGIRKCYINREEIKNNIFTLEYYYDHITNELFFSNYTDSITFLSFSLGNKIIIKTNKCTNLSLKIEEFKNE